MPNRTAIVIDDEPDLTAYISSILEDHGFTVMTANDAVGGEKLIREAPPDVVLLDLMMPGKSGISLFTTLRRDEATREIPLVMVTGIKEKTGIDWGEIVDRFEVRRPDGFVEKPIDPERLWEVVQAVLSSAGAERNVFHG